MESVKKNTAEVEALKEGKTAKTKPAGQVITGLKKEIAELKKELEVAKEERIEERLRLSNEIDALRNRVHEKELLVNRTEEEADAKVANKDLVIRGMRTTMETLTKENARLKAEVNNLNGIVMELRSKGERKGLFARIFGK